MSDLSEHYIECPRFGGSRSAFACCTLDRYRTCRSRCTSLAKHLKTYPDLPAQAKRCYDKKKGYQTGDLLALLTKKFAGKGLPDLALQCPWCKFKAKSPRGKKLHLKRKHFGRGIE